MNPLLHIQPTIASQAEAVAGTVTKAYEKDVLVGTIVLLSIAVVALFTLLVRSYRTRAEEMKEVSEINRIAMETKSANVAIEFEKKDTRLFAIVERVTEAMVNVSNNLQTFTEEIRDLKGRQR